MAQANEVCINGSTLNSVLNPQNVGRHLWRIPIHVTQVNGVGINGSTLNIAHFKRRCAYDLKRDYSLMINANATARHYRLTSLLAFALLMLLAHPQMVAIYGESQHT